MKIIDKILKKVIDKLLEKNVRVSDSNILIELRKITDEQIEEIIKSK